MENPHRNAQLGYIKSVPDDMEGLFKRWYKRTEDIGKDEKDGDQHYCLVCDGIMRKRGKSEEKIEDEWEKDKKRIAILIKDENQKEKDGAPWADDTRNWLIQLDSDDTPKKKRQKTRNWNVTSKFLKNIAQTIWGITNSEPENFMPNNGVNTDDFAAIQESFREVPFALIECKKQAGKASIDDNTLSYYLETYRDLLYEEFDILEPHIFVCTNERIYKFVQDYITEYRYKGTLLTHVKSMKGDKEHEPSILLHIPSKTVILCSFHPSANMHYEDFFDGVVAHYHAFLKSEPKLYREFFE
jgi:hypothetical protein